MHWHDATGRGVNVAVIDSGIHAQHPHVRGVAGGVSIHGHAAYGEDTADVLGHGTAVAAAIREKAPDVELYAVRVFDRNLSTTIGRLVSAIEWAIDAQAHIINLSLGTPRAAHVPVLNAAISRAAARGVLIVAAQEDEGTVFYPGSLPGVIPVRLDWTCPRESYQVGESTGSVSFLASGFPRPIPGVPQSANLKGISFAVANMSGIIARLCEVRGRISVNEAIAGTRAIPEPPRDGVVAYLTRDSLLPAQLGVDLEDASFRDGVEVFPVPVFLLQCGYHHCRQFVTGLACSSPFDHPRS